MKYLMVIALLFTIGCGSMSKPKKTYFYKDGKLVKTFKGRGMFAGDEWFGNYRIWAMDGWRFYEYKCVNCEVKEEVIQN